MKVLHINQSDLGGGAAIAGYRLHQGLLRSGIDSRLLVGFQQTDSARVATVPRLEALESRLGRIGGWLGLNHLNYLSSFKIVDHPFYREAEILNLHNLHTGFFNYLAIPRLTRDKPAVFTLHDMWSFTGHCAYSYECERWQNACGRCPHPEEYPPIRRDATWVEMRLKKWVYRRSTLAVVTPSRWLADLAQKSMLGRFDIQHIPNGIDTRVYRPLDQGLCRDLLGIPRHRKVLLFGASGLNDPRKGGILLVEALKRLPPRLKAEALLVTFGSGGQQLAETVGMESLSLGFIGSDRLKAVVFSAADLLVFPTRADNLPLILQESLACGTPMVSLRVGGVPELVRPDVTGYLATPEDADDLKHGIVALLEDSGLRERLGGNCRRIAKKEYCLEQMTSRYAALYRQLLEAKK